MVPSKPQVLAVMVGGWLAASAWAAEPPGPVIGETIDVRVVNVEAVVTDEKGERVRGLTPADFRLLVDGKEVPVDYFTEVADGETARTAGGAEGPVAPLPPEEQVGRSYLVFIDESFSVAEQRDSILTSLEQGLTRFSPADRMAVLAFDGKEIDVLSPWTSDTAALARVLREARQRETRGSQILAQHRSVQGDVDMLAEAAAQGLLEGDQLIEANKNLQKRVSPEARTQLGRTAPAIAAALRSFETPPGRKVMFLLSAGWSLTVAPQLFSPVLEAANRLGYTLYPVDASVHTPDVLQFLDFFAARTGGKVVTANLQRDAFQQVQDDSASFYWLGFTPSWKGDNRRHAVGVEVRRPGLQVRARSSFSDLARPTEAGLRAEGILLFGGSSQEKRLVVKLGEPRPAGRREVELPVSLSVPIDALVLTQGEGGYVAELPLAVSAIDAKGGRADLPGMRLKIVLRQIPKGGGLARFQALLKVRRLEQRLVFTVEDATRGSFLWGEAQYLPLKGEA